MPHKPRLRRALADATESLSMLRKQRQKPDIHPDVRRALDRNIVAMNCLRKTIQRHLGK